MNEHNLFAICEKCNGKVFKHEGFIEAPAGKYTFRMRCGCGFVFQWIFVTEKFRASKTGEITGNIVGDMMQTLMRVKKKNVDLIDEEDDR